MAKCTPEEYMEEFLKTDMAENILKYFTSGRFLLTMITIVAAVTLIVLISKLFSFYLKKQKEMNKDNMSREHMTLVHVVASILSGIIFVISVIFILQVNGVQVSSLITSVSIISAVVGLALQDTIKDLIQGIQILTDKFFQVGDVVKIDNYEGIVTKFTMRSTRIRDIRTLNDITIANRNLSKVEKSNDKKYIHIPVSYDEPVAKMFPIFEDIAVLIGEDEEIKAARFMGLSRLEQSSMDYLMEVTCDPQFTPRCLRKANKVIVEELNARGIKIPYSQLDVHMK